MNESQDNIPETAASRPSRRKIGLILFVLSAGLVGLGLYSYNRSLPGGAGKKGGDAAAMQSTPVPEQQTKTAAADSGIGQIFIAPERQQLIGVKTAFAEMKPLIQEIRTV